MALALAQIELKSCRDHHFTRNRRIYILLSEVETSNCRFWSRIVSQTFGSIFWHLCRFISSKRFRTEGAPRQRLCIWWWWKCKLFFRKKFEHWIARVLSKPLEKEVFGQLLAPRLTNFCLVSTRMLSMMRQIHRYPQSDFLSTFNFSHSKPFWEEHVFGRYSGPGGPIDL